MRIHRILRGSLLSLVMAIAPIAGCDRGTGKSQQLPQNTSKTTKTVLQDKSTGATQPEKSVAEAPPAQSQLPGKPNENAYNSLLEWTAETEASFARQRPTAFVVICEDYGTSYLQTPAVVTMKLAESLANCGYDVRILVGLFNTSEPAKHPTIGTVCALSTDINTKLDQRNLDEKVHEHIAPLKRLARPGVFATRAEFWAHLTDWLEGTFHSPGKLIRQQRIHGRPPFGMIYFNGHGGWHERPGRAATGKEPAKQSISRDIFYAPPDLDLVEKDQGLPQMAGEISIQDVAMTAALQYQAPLWICADMCRKHIFDGPGIRLLPTPARMSMLPRQLRSSDFKLNADLAKTVADIEELRRNAISSNIAFDEYTRNSTLLFPDEHRRSVKDSVNLSLGFHFGKHLAVDSPINGANPHFVDAEGKPTVLTLKQIFESARDRIRSQSMNDAARKKTVIMNPKLDPGPIDENMVVAAATRDFEYPQIYLNILPGNVTVEHRLTGFTVPCDSSDKVLGNVVAITREQANLDERFVAYFHLDRKPRLSPDRAYKLVLKVVARSDKSEDEIRYVVGAYDEDHNLLTTHFSDYGSAQSFLEPIPCDGEEHFRETPLDSHLSIASDLCAFEIQAAPNEPEENWPYGATLTLTGAYIVPADTTIDDVNKSINDTEERIASSNIIPQWWCVTPLGVQPHESINRALQPRKSGDVKLNLSKADLSKKTWGVIGDIYPRHRFEKDMHMFRVKAAKSATEYKAGRVTICVYSADRLVAATSATLEALASGIDVPFVDSCIADEIAIAIEGAPEVTIEQFGIVEVKK